MIQTPIVFFSWFRDVLFMAFSSMGDKLLSINAQANDIFPLFNRNAVTCPFYVTSVN